MSRLSHIDKHFGLFTNSRGETKPGYLLWKHGRGYLLYSESGKPLVTEGFETLARMKLAGVDFTITKSEKRTSPAASSQERQAATV